VAAVFNLEIHTPYRLFFNGKAQSITLQLADGEICAYANHCAFTAPVVTSVLNFKDEGGKTLTAFISGGILQVKEHKYILMVNAAEWPEEIDKARALSAKQQAEETLKNANFRFETVKAKEKLRRAECRLRVAR